MNKPMENIIAKFLAGEASEKEILLVDNWRQENQQEFEKYQKAYSHNIFEVKKFEKEVFDKSISKKVDEKHVFFFNKNSMLLKIAAVFMGIVIAGSLFFYSKSLVVTTTNNSGYVSTVILPDGSNVTLSNHATLTYNKGWFGNFNRQVNLQGKAFFHITKSKTKHFTVLTSKINVTVLGTKFVVNELLNKTQVVLAEGTVSLDGPAIKSELIINKPGSQVIVNDKIILTDNIVDQTLYTSWLRSKIEFKNCKVSQVVDMLYNSYNVKVNLTDNKLLNKKLFGSAPSDDPELIVSALSHILNTKLVTGETP